MPPLQNTHRDDSWLFDTQELLQLTHRKGDLDEPLQPIRRIPRKLLLPSFRANIPLNIHPNSRTLTSRPTQPKHDPRSIGKLNHLPLILRHRLVDWIFVLKVVHSGDSELGRGRCGEMGRVEEGVR